MVSAVSGIASSEQTESLASAASTTPLTYFGRALTEAADGAAAENQVSEGIGPDWRLLFVGSSSTPETAAEPEPPPTARSLFGESPWVSNPTELLPDGRSLGLNPYYFATPETAAKVAEILGGKVVEMNAFTADSSPVVQQQPNQMILMPDGRLVNAGLVASYYDHGLPQQMIDQMIADIVTPQAC